MTNQELLFTGVVVYLSAYLGWTIHADAQKTEVMERELGGKRHLRWFFGFVGIFENRLFEDHLVMTMTYPGLNEVDTWARVLGPVWIRLGTRPLNEMEMCNYQATIYHHVNAKLLEREQQNELGANQGQAAAGDRPPEEPPHNPVC